MIGFEHINGALEVINPQHDAIASIGMSFGNEEAVPMMEAVLRQFQVDPDAIRAFASAQLTYYITEGDSPELAAEKANAVMLGFNVGVAAARLAASEDFHAD